MSAIADILSRAAPPPPPPPSRRRGSHAKRSGREEGAGGRGRGGGGGLSSPSVSDEPRLTFDVLRKKFERQCGVPFGCCGFGSLMGFLRKHPHKFRVFVSKKKKHRLSSVSLV